MICAIFVLVKGSLFQFALPNVWELDLVLITIAYLFVSFGEMGAGIFAFGMGLFVDMYSVGPEGLFTLIYLILFMGIRFGGLLVDLFSLTGQMVFMAGAYMVKTILFFLMLQLFSVNVDISSSYLGGVLSSALCTGLMTPMVFFFYDRMGKVLTEATAKDRKRET